MIFAVTALILCVLIVVAIVQRQSSPSLAGTWRLASIGNLKIPANASGVDQQIKINEAGTFVWPSYQAEGKWTIDGATLTMHTEKYNGATKAEFLADIKAKYPSDASMQKISEKVFEDIKLSLNPEHTILTLDLSGTKQTFVKKTGPGTK